MKALLIGGTGVISTSISNLLIEQGWELYILNRGSKNQCLPEGVQFLQTDIHDEQQVAKLIMPLKFDVVADFIAYLPSHIERDYRLFKNKTKQFIFISSASIYQKPLSYYKVTESTPLNNPYWEYSRNKITCENELLQKYREKDFPITIVRPSQTYDEHIIPVGLHGKKGSWQVIKRMITGKPIIIHGDGTSLWTLTHARDFAKGFVGIMGNAHAIGETIHITSDEVLSWNQIYESIANALGVQINVIHIASEFLAACSTEDLKGSLIGDKAHSIVFDNSKIKRLVPGFVATTQFEQGVKESIHYLLTHPEYQVEDPVFDTWCDKVIDAQREAIRKILNNDIKS